MPSSASSSPNEIHNFGDLAFTPSVRAVQERMGSRASYARLAGREQRVRLGAEEAAFIAARDSFYLASVGENGWPYVQHRGGPRGFLRVLGEQTLGFADFRGNRQYLSTGNVLADARVCLFLMDYAQRERLKIWAEAEVVVDAATVARLLVPGGPVEAERAFLFRVVAFDWNCPQFITPRYTPDELAALGLHVSPT